MWKSLRKVCLRPHRHRENDPACLPACCCPHMEATSNRESRAVQGVRLGLLDFADSSPNPNLRTLPLLWTSQADGTFPDRNTNNVYPGIGITYRVKVLTTPPGTAVLSIRMQCPPIPTFGWNGINPYGFVPAAANTSSTGIPIAPITCANSFTKPMFINLNVFSNNFAASATSGDETGTTASQNEP